MAIRMGGTAINKIYLGSSTVQKVYLGSSLVWSNQVAPPQRRATTVLSMSSNGATSYTESYPADSVAGDLIVVQVLITKANTSAFTDGLSGGPTWNFLGNTDGFANGIRYSYYWAFRGSETTFTVTPTPNSFGRNIVVAVAAYDGATVDLDNPVYALRQSYNVAASATGMTSDMYAPVDNTDILIFRGGIHTANVSMLATFPNSTELGDGEFYNSAVPLDHGASIAADVRATSGLSPTYTVTLAASQSVRMTTAIAIMPPNSGPYQVSQTPSSGEPTTGATSSITMPAGNTGDLMLVEVSASASQTLSTASSGWTKVGQVANADTVAIFAGIKGTAVSPLVVSFSNTTQHRCWNTRIIRRWSGNIADIEMATATATGTTPNPPSLTPTGGAKQRLWLALAGVERGTYVPVDSPSGFGLFQQVLCSATSATAHTGHGSAIAGSSAASLDPGAFPAGTSNAHTVLTLAVP